MVIYICLSVFSALILLLWKKFHLREEIRLYFALGFAIGFLGLVSAINGNDIKLETDETGNTVFERKSHGHGAYTKKLVLEMEGVQRDYSIRIEDEHLSESEVNAAFISAIERIDSSFFGRENCQDEVRGSVNPVKLMEVEVAADEDPGEKLKADVNVSYSYQPSGVIASDGTLRDDKIDENGSLVQVTAVLSCDGRQVEHVFSLMAYRTILTDAEEAVAVLEEDITEQNNGDGGYISLPSEINGVKLNWSLPKHGDTYNILLLGVLAAVGLFIAKREDRKKKIKQRRTELERGYPMMVSALSLLIGAGMTVSAAWERIVTAYVKRVESGRGKDAVYEEMLLTLRQIRDGKSEKDSLSGFAERTNIGIYRKLISMILQNLRKGGRELDVMLEREVENAYELMRNQAKMKGAEASTKMLLPMMLSLLVVIVVIIVPALYTMEF